MEKSSLKKCQIVVTIKILSGKPQQTTISMCGPDDVAIF